MIRRAWTVPFLAMLALTVAGAASAAIVVVPPRAGQLGIGIAGQYGTLLQTGGNFQGTFGATRYVDV